MFKRQRAVALEVPRIGAIPLGDPSVLSDPRKRARADSYLAAAVAYAQANRDELDPEARELVARLAPLLADWATGHGATFDPTPDGLSPLVEVARLGLAAGWVEMTQLRPQRGTVDPHAHAILSHIAMRDLGIVPGFVFFCGRFVGRRGRTGVDLVFTQLSNDIATS